MSCKKYIHISTENKDCLLFDFEMLIRYTTKTHTKIGKQEIFVCKFNLKRKKTNLCAIIRLTGTACVQSQQEASELYCGEAITSEYRG